jgi:hypothetical protein
VWPAVAIGAVTFCEAITVDRAPGMVLGLIGLMPLQRQRAALLVASSAV